MGGRASFVLSTGRCGTQFLASALSEALPDATVEHEPLRAGYVPERVFRVPGGRFAAVLGRHVPIQRKLIEVQDIVAEGRTYIDTGWPIYAWLPYLARRFGSALAFVHLVRAPYPFAASLLTHRFFTTRDDAYATRALVLGSTGHVAHPRLAAEWPDYAPFEKALFHWLEVNAFAAEQHGRNGFAGLWRMEEVFSDAVIRAACLTAIAGRPLELPQADRVDAHSAALKTAIAPPRSSLRDAVEALARRLGYGDADLALQPGDLAAAYGTARVPRPA